MGEALFVFMFLLAIHWIADFVLQTDWQAKNKSKDNRALLSHVATYTLALSVGILASGSILFTNPLVTFGLIPANAAAHFATDYVTSRINSRLWAEGRVHAFFVSVGFDQLIHQFCLAATAYALVLA